MMYQEAQRFIQADDGRSPFWTYQAASRALDDEVRRLQTALAETIEARQQDDLLYREALDRRLAEIEQLKADVAEAEQAREAAETSDFRVGYWRLQERL